LENIVLSNNIEGIISQQKYFENLYGRSILVTGATGLLGSILIKSLIRIGNIKIYACCRSIEKFNRVFEDYKSINLVPLFFDILNLDISNISIDFIIHGASITDSKTFIEHPVETIDTALDGTRNLLKQCINKDIIGFVYLSSLEVYGTFNNTVEVRNIKENDAGYIDSMSVRSSYSEGKRMVETICKSYQSEYGVPVKIARLCQTFGAGVDYNDNRVFAQFARAIIEHRDIVLKTKGETVRNYCHTTDAVSGILTILSKGTPGEAYNVANMSTTISIVDMAKLFCSLYPESECRVVYDIVEDPGQEGYNPVVKIKLDSSKISILGWQPVEDINKMILDLTNYMIEEKNSR